MSYVKSSLFESETPLEQAERELRDAEEWAEACRKVVEGLKMTPRRKLELRLISMPEGTVFTYVFQGVTGILHTKVAIKKGATRFCVTASESIYSVDALVSSVKDYEITVLDLVNLHPVERS